ncbi:MAG: methyltransferase domain-containing protein [Bacteroidota bacterium]|nr:methyltransferase domain-containing protein [Bacteroidota bacterium]
MYKNTKNKIPNLDTLSLEVYNDKEFAQSYSNKIEYNSHNALYERPATLSLLPDVHGKKILDAGCGPGRYAEWLVDKGAFVTAIDYSDEMISLTKEKLGDKAKIVKANLNLPLDFLEDEEFDVIISSMVIHYIKDWQMLFSEFNRVLKREGVLIFSTDNPVLVYSIYPDGNYFETELVKEKWTGYGIEMSFYKRPLSDIFRTLKECDFRFDEMLEPQPVEECKEKFPDAYETLSKKPWFLCFRVIKEK